MTDRGWSQTDVVRRAGRDRSLFTRIQSGRRLDHDVILDLARTFTVSPAEFLVRLGYTPEQLGATLTTDPRPLRPDELLYAARTQLSDDDLLDIVRERMTNADVLGGDDDLTAQEPAPAVQAGRREYTGRRRARSVDAAATRPAEGG